VRDEFEERSAIMEFDGGMSRDEAEGESWALVSKLYRLHRGQEHGAQETELLP
jgi:hypothetical protein